MRKLKIKKGAPSKPPFFPGWQYDDATTCISPTDWYLEGGPNRHGKFRCNSRGILETDRGMICIAHARVYARRGWINIDVLRKILEERARETARKAALRASCLHRGKCI